MPQRVVIVSENAKTRETLAQAVRERGGKPTLAGTADEAQRVLETVAADAVLLETRRVDIRARRARTRLEQVRPGCRVVLVTSFAAVRQSPDLLHFDADDFLIGAESLLDILEPSRFSVDTARIDDGDRGFDALVQTMDVLVGLLELAADALLLETLRLSHRRPEAVQYLNSLSRDRRDHPAINVVLALFERDARNDESAKAFLSSVVENYRDSPVERALSQPLAQWPPDFAAITKDDRLEVDIR